MLSQITFILSLVLFGLRLGYIYHCDHSSNPASGTDQLIGTWRYEGQFVVGSPKLSWDMAGWKLMMDVVVASPQPNSSEVTVNFLNPLILAINGRVPEKTPWTQLNKMGWWQSDISQLQKPFTVQFKRNVVESIFYDKLEAKHSVDIKLAFAHQLQAALLDKKIMNKTKSYMGNCDTKISMKNSTHLENGVPKEDTIVTTYHQCDNSEWPIVGVIPKLPGCVSCERYPWKLPLDSFAKVEVGRVGKKIMSILRQDVVVLPIYHTNSPQYSIYGNSSLIRIQPLKETKIHVIEDSVMAKNYVKHQLNDTSNSHGKYQTKHEATLEEDSIVNEAVRLIEAIVSATGHARVGDNIYALYDLLAENEWAIPRIEAKLTSKSSRNVLYSFLITQESPIALETLLKAVLNKEIPVPAVPAIMILSAKVTAMTNVTLICKFIETIKHECHFCAEVSYLALSIIVRRNGKYMSPNLKNLMCLPTEPRWLLAVAGNVGINKKMMIPTTNVPLKLAYIQSKRALQVPTPDVHQELIDIVMDPKDELVVRIEAFKVIMGMTCDKVVWSSIFARLNEINDEALLNYVITHLETLASIKLPVYSFMSKLAQEWLPVLKIEKSLCQSSRSVGVSTYNANTNMGVAVLADYAVPKRSWEKYMTASIEVQPFIMNTLLSTWKIQAIIPKAEMVVLVDLIRTWKMDMNQIMHSINTSVQRIINVLAKSEVKIFNDDMEILIINNPAKLMAWIESVIPMLRMSATLRGCILPIVVKKTIPSVLGPQVVLSAVSYVSMETAYEVLTTPSWGITVTPKITTGTRLRLQASNRVAMDIGTQVEAVFETNQIKAVIEKEGTTHRLVTLMEVQTTPVLSLRVIPSTGSELGVPKRSWEEQTTPSTWAKIVPINLVLGLEEPAIAINVSGLVSMPVNENWVFALQNPQLLQVYLLPKYKLPSDVLVIEWALSKSKCPTSKYCSWKNATPIRNAKWCQKLCINAWNPEATKLTAGAALTVAQKTSSLIVDSKINITGCNRCIYTANVKWSLPALVNPLDLFNNEYINLLKKHTFNPLPSMGVTQKETEVTKQLEQIRNALFLTESREEDYSDMFMDIMNLYPSLYFNDTLKIKGLHKIMKTLIIMSTKALQSRSQRYTPAWNEIEQVRQNLLVILKTPLKIDLPEVVVMQDHVILWCVTKYFEIAVDWYTACGECAQGRELISKSKATIFSTWKIFYEKSKKVVEGVLPKSPNLDILTTTIFSSDKILIELIEAVESTPILMKYKTLANSLKIINQKIQALEWSEKVLASKTVMVKLVGFELLKTLGDHWQVSSQKRVVLEQKRAKTDLGVSFLSVAARVIMQATDLLVGKTEVDTIKVNALVKQAIQLIDYRRWLRMSLIDDAEIPHLKEATKMLLTKTTESLEILSLLPVNVTLDPMWNLFVTGVMAVHRLTVVELKNVPRYALYEGTKVGLNEMEWKITALWKTLFKSNRPWSTLKRNVLKNSQIMLKSSSKSKIIDYPVKIEVSIQWINLTVNATIQARKSDSQVIREIQETTMSKSWPMMRYLQNHLNMKDTHLWIEPLWLELNVYQEIQGWMTVEGHIPSCLKSRVPTWIETVKTLVLPFESALTAEESELIKKECHAAACFDAVLSRDNKKVDLLWVDPNETMGVIQLPTTWKWW